MNYIPHEIRGKQHIDSLKLKTSKGYKINKWWIFSSCNCI